MNSSRSLLLIFFAAGLVLSAVVIGWAWGGTESPVVSEDEQLSLVGEQVNAFGGIFLDPGDNSIAYAYLLDPARIEDVEDAARAYLGNDFYDFRINEVRVLRGQYSITNLRDWYIRLRDPSSALPAVYWADLN